MKAIILNFSAFGGKKDPNKAYYRFDMYDIEGKALYNIFQEQQYTGIPDGVIPTDKERSEDFPRIAEVDFRIRQFLTKENKPAFAPQVVAIKSWKKLDLTKV